MAVMLGINPYKRSYTAVALDGTDKVLGQLRVAADRRQVDRLLRFSTAWPDHVWAVENANGLGRLLSRGPLEAGRPRCALRPLRAPPAGRAIPPEPRGCSRCAAGRLAVARPRHQGR